VFFNTVFYHCSVGDGGILLETLSPSSSDDENDEEYLPENDSSWHQVFWLLTFSCKAYVCSQFL